MAKYEYTGSPYMQRDVRSHHNKSLWELGQNHRKFITHYLTAHDAVAPEETLGIWLAGAGIELDLPKLLGRYSHIEILANHPDRVKELAVWQKVDSNPGVSISPRMVEPFFALQQSIKATRATASADQLNSLLQLLQTTPPMPTKGSLDCLASIDLYTSEMIENIFAIGETHPRLMDLVQAQRAYHFRKMLAAMKTGGRGVVIFQVVTSESLPILTQMGSARLPDILAKSILDKNFLTGCNPMTMQRWLQNDESIKSQVRDVVVLNPWIWETWEGIAAMIAVEFFKV
jgi:hypothetical protein